MIDIKFNGFSKYEKYDEIQKLQRKFLEDPEYQKLEIQSLEREKENLRYQLEALISFIGENPIANIEYKRWRIAGSPEGIQYKKYATNDIPLKILENEKKSV